MHSWHTSLFLIFSIFLGFVVHQCFFKSATNFQNKIHIEVDLYCSNPYYPKVTSTGAVETREKFYPKSLQESSTIHSHNSRQPWARGSSRNKSHPRNVLGESQSQFRCPPVYYSRITVPSWRISPLMPPRKNLNKPSSYTCPSLT